MDLNIYARKADEEIERLKQRIAELEKERDEFATCVSEFSMMPDEEMTLQEWVNRLSKNHLANREYQLLIKRIAELEKKVAEMGWQINPDRMGG